LGAGLNDQVPSPLTVKSPSARLTVVPGEYVVPSTVKSVTVSVSFSTSVSLLMRLPDAGVSSCIVRVSSTATGASLTAATGPRLSVAVSVSAPSDSVYVTAGTGPL